MFTSLYIQDPGFYRVNESVSTVLQFKRILLTTIVAKKMRFLILSFLVLGCSAGLPSFLTDLPISAGQYTALVHGNHAFIIFIHSSLFHVIPIHYPHRMKRCVIVTLIYDNQPFSSSSLIATYLRYPNCKNFDWSCEYQWFGRFEFGMVRPIQH